MTRTLLVLLLFAGWSLYARWYYICPIKHHACCEETTTPADSNEVVVMEKLALKDGNDNILEGYDQFTFAPSSFAVNPSANNTEFLNKTCAHLKANPDKNLTISGFYLDSEKTASSGILENIGLARADALRNLLIKCGIAQDRIFLDSRMLEGNAMTETLRFTLSNKVKKGEKALAQESFTFTNMSFSDANFDYNSDKFVPGPQFGLYADSLATYMKMNPGKKVTLTGHTDNSGKDDYNMRLGKSRAEAVKAWMVNNNKIKGTIITVSKGETEPAFPNDSEENMRKNRRVNVRIE